MDEPLLAIQFKMGCFERTYSVPQFILVPADIGGGGHTASKPAESSVTRRVNRCVEGRIQALHYAVEQ